MLGLIAFLVATPVADGRSDQALAWALAEPLSSSEDERARHLIPSGRERGKKELWRLEKANRPRIRIDDPIPPSKLSKVAPAAKHAATLEAEAKLATAMPGPGTRVQPITTLFNIWNREALPLFAGQPYKQRFQLFLRDHYTRQSTLADTRLALVLAAAAIRFHAPRIDIVSGYRSPKYNLMLRKKGHQVARESQHTQGTAVDFRIRGVTTEALRDFVRGLHLGGVGYYPRTHFVHADTGKIRFWEGS